LRTSTRHIRVLIARNHHKNSNGLSEEELE
jgi:hypothetical protein